MINILYALILYTSDEPEKFAYFTQSFTNRLNEISDAKFIEDKSIENEFFVELLRNKSSKEFENNLIQETQLLKNKILKNQWDEAHALSHKQLHDFAKNLLNNPYEISHATQTNFYFWNIIANLKDSKKTDEILGPFLISATLAQKNRLESELPYNLYEKFSQVLTTFKRKQLRKYTVTNHEKCRVFLNGVAISQDSFFISTKETSVLNALCPTGFYSQQINSLSNSTVKILPYIVKSYASMPPIQLFPIKLLTDKKIHTLLFIHWSSKNHYIQTTLANPSNLNEKRELRIQLKTSEDRQEAGDKMSQFIFTYFKSLIE